MKHEHGGDKKQQPTHNRAGYAAWTVNATKMTQHSSIIAARSTTLKSSSRFSTPVWCKDAFACWFFGFASSFDCRPMIGETVSVKWRQSRFRRMRSMLNLLSENSLTRERAKLAQSVRKIVRDSAHSRPPIRGYWPLVRPDVARTCAPQLTRIAELLEDPSSELTGDALKPLRDFLTEGATSPLYGYNVSAAVAGIAHVDEALQAVSRLLSIESANRPAKVVLATDGSVEAAHATQSAVRLCRQTGAQLAVVTVRTMTPMGRRGFGPPIHANESINGELKLSETVARQARAEGIEATAYARSGDPAVEIARLADDLHADMIITGSRGYGPIRGALAGSVSHNLIKRAHVPVTVQH